MKSAVHIAMSAIPSEIAQMPLFHSIRSDAERRLRAASDGTSVCNACAANVGLETL
jgi:hypothetical protein